MAAAVVRQRPYEHGVAGRGHHLDSRLHGLGNVVPAQFYDRAVRDVRVVHITGLVLSRYLPVGLQPPSVDAAEHDRPVAVAVDDSVEGSTGTHHRCIR